MKILLDVNEVSTAPWVFTQIANHPLLGIPEVVNLPAGDIWLDNVIIERKEPHDLLESIKDGRLFNQCAEMRLHSDHCYLLILGQLIWGYDGKIIGIGWNFRSIQGALLQVQELGVGVVYAQDKTDLATSLVWLHKRNQINQIILPQRKQAESLSPEIQMLSSLPGIGLERATELLKNYNLIDALLCLIDEDCKVNGIGPKTKQNIRNLLNLAQGETLQKVTKNE